jgi:CubicO group peptidase (beta-lactamase class C family)
MKLAALTLPLLAAAATCAPPAAAQQPTPSGNAPDPRVDAIFAEWDRSDSPGCALGVYRDGSIVYARGYGMADLERGVPITPATIFDIGSTSKQFAAVSIVLLAQDGLLSLDDDVRHHVPELPEYERPITIRHMLQHTSGLRDYIGLLTLGGARIDDVTTADDALAAIVRQRRLNFAPGDEYLYSNSGFFLLSVIVERVAGRSLRDFARERIFEPLGMERTHYLGSYDDIVPNRALAYAPRGDGLRTDMSRWLQLGDGAVFTSVEELLHWDRNFHEPRVGGESMLAELQATGRLAGGQPITYGLGLNIDQYRGLRTVSHGGAWGGYRAELLRFPDQRFSVATLCNIASANPPQLARRVAGVYLEDILAPASAAIAAAAGTPAAFEIDPATLREMAGTYRDTLTRMLRPVTFVDDRLHVHLGERYPLLPVGPAEFIAEGTPAVVRLAFADEDAAGVRRARLTVGTQQPAVLERVALITASGDELAAYAGQFYSDELQATYSFSVKDGVLVVRTRGADPQPLRPTTRDEFLAGGLVFRFSRAAGGVVDGFRLDAGRLRHLDFRRTDGQRQNR